MRIKCLHGYFLFTEDRAGEAADFMNWSGTQLVPVKDYYTFEQLENAPDYSIAGKAMLDYPATVTFEGEPWEVFEANKIVYNFSLGVVLPIATVVQQATIKQAGNIYFSNGLLMPGSVIAGGKKVKDYAAYWSKTTLGFRYSDVTFV